MGGRVNSPIRPIRPGNNMSEQTTGVRPGETSVVPSQSAAATPEPANPAQSAESAAKEKPLSRAEQILRWVSSDASREAKASDPNHPAGAESRPADEKVGAKSDLSHSPPESEAQRTSQSESSPEDDASGGEEAAAADESEGAGDADAGAEKPEGGRWPKGALERIRKLKDQRNQARDQAQSKDREIEELRERLARVERKGAGVEPTVADEVETLTDEGAIAERQRTAESVAAWAAARISKLAYGDHETVARDLEAIGLKAPEDGWDPKSMGEALEGLRERGEHVAKRAAPARIAWLRNETQVVETVGQAFPELADPKSDLQREVQDVLEAMPGIRQQSNWLLLATVGAIGLREFRRRTAKPEESPNPKPPKPAPPGKPPRVPGVPGAAAAAPKAGSDLAALREAAIRKGASAKDRQAYIKAQLAAGRT